MKSKTPRKTKLTWSEQCRDPKWQRLRAERMILDSYACQECGDTKRTLNVHHRFYRRNSRPWEYKVHELVTFCEDCHWETEQRLDEIKRVAGMGDKNSQEQILRYMRRIKPECFILPALVPEPVTEEEKREPITPEQAASGFAALRAMMEGRL